MLLFCEWGVLWCPNDFLQDMEISLCSLSPFLAIQWLMVGDKLSVRLRAERCWAPALSAESSGRCSWPLRTSPVVLKLMQPSAGPWGKCLWTPSDGGFQVLLHSTRYETITLKPSPEIACQDFAGWGLSSHSTGRAWRRKNCAWLHALIAISQLKMQDCGIISSVKFVFICAHTDKKNFKVSTSS